MFSAKFVAAAVAMLAVVSGAAAAPAASASASASASSAIKASGNSTDVTAEAAAAAHHGDATFYQPGLGACGHTNTASQHVVALAAGDFNGGNACGRHLTAHHNGKSVKVKVVDLCGGCSAGDLDLSPSAFKKLAPLPKGRIPVTWSFA